MPGRIRWNPSREPFSYAKLCFYYLPGLLIFIGIAALVVSAFGGLQWLDQVGSWLPSSSVLRGIIGAALIVAYYLFFMKVLWRLLPANIRARIPYDRQEAIESKGDVKSFLEFCKLVVRALN